MAGSTRTVARDLVHDGGAQRLGLMRPLSRAALHERLERLRLERLHLRLQDVLALKLGGRIGPNLWAPPSCFGHRPCSRQLGLTPSFSARTS